MRKKLNSGKQEWVDPDDAPALDASFFEKAVIRNNGRIISRGRPPKGVSKEQVTLRIDADVLAAFKAGGAGWQTRINEALRSVKP